MAKRKLKMDIINPNAAGIDIDIHKKSSNNDNEGNIHYKAEYHSQQSKHDGTIDPGSISIYPLSNLPLLIGSTLNLYTELKDVPCYKDSVIFAILACPICLLDAEILSILVACIDDVSLIIFLA